MLNPKRGSDPHRALRLIADSPGDLSAADLAGHLWPLPRLTGTEGYLSWRASLRPVIVGRQHGRHIDVRSAVMGERDAKASRMVRRLAEAGLVESRGAPTLADWFRDRWERRAARILTDWRALGYDVEPTPLAARADALWALVGGDGMRKLLVLEVANGPPSVASVLGAKPSGHEKRTWSALCDEGIILPPSRRWLTEKGRALLDRLDGKPPPCCEDGGCTTCRFP